MPPLGPGFLLVRVIFPSLFFLGNQSTSSRGISPHFFTPIPPPLTFSRWFPAFGARQNLALSVSTTLFSFRRQELGQGRFSSPARWVFVCVLFFLLRYFLSQEAPPSDHYERASNRRFFPTLVSAGQKVFLKGRVGPCFSAPAGFLLPFGGRRPPCFCCVPPLCFCIAESLSLFGK